MCMFARCKSVIVVYLKSEIPNRARASPRPVSTIPIIKIVIPASICFRALVCLYGLNIRLYNRLHK
jgi:hypothetical protein